MGVYHDVYLRTDDLPEDLPEAVWPRSSSLLHKPRLELGRAAEEEDVELEILTDYDMHVFIEKGLRCGISIVSKPYAKANNPKVAGYDPTKTKSHILYLDANNRVGDEPGTTYRHFRVGRGL